MAPRISLLAGLLFLSTLALAVPEPHTITPSPEYFVQDLGTLPGDTDSVAWGIDASGAVVGSSYTASGYGTRGFLFTDSQGLADVTGGDRPGALVDVNDAGQMAGDRPEADGGPAFPRPGGPRAGF